MRVNIFSGWNLEFALGYGLCFASAYVICCNILPRMLPPGNEVRVKKLVGVIGRG